MSSARFKRDIREMGKAGAPGDLQVQERPGDAETHNQAAENQRQTSQIAKLSLRMAEVRADRDRERAAFEKRLSALELTISALDRAPKLAAALGR